MIDPRLDTLYYLKNFMSAIRWLAQMYADLLSEEETEFIDQFESLPVNAQALLVRLIMRKHDCFRASKISYPEIGDIQAAAVPLVAVGWLDDEPLLTLAELFGLLRREEIEETFCLDVAARALTKSALLSSLQPLHLHLRTFESWRSSNEERVYRVCIADLCANLRLVFFGSFHQDWSEFVLADLGIFKYEKLELGMSSRGFRCRQDIDFFYDIYRCRAALHADAPLAEVLAELPAEPVENAWLEDRRAKLLFEIAHRYERQGDVDNALAIYRQSTYPGARLRSIRLLERAGAYAEALDAAEAAYREPESAAELQGLERIIPRLYRSVGMEIEKQVRPPVARLDLSLQRSEFSVEESVRRHLESDAAPVFYVENALLTSLFGLLFWEAIFAPVPGAFFHPFHSAPMDLYEPEFVRRRQCLVDDCFAQLESGEYAATIRKHLKEKEGIASPFVAWGMIDETLIDLAILCLPPAHLALLFRRILDDIRENCTGLPDLIQFWPDARRYRFIEVKGPGDRLQDHQQRWVQFCSAHEMPICVAYVRWDEVRA
jgi:hypothetical protein